jgi:ribosomal protein S18 acetylase RimI-like enzyme
LNVEVRELGRKDIPWLADLHNQAFADYPVGAHLDATALGSYLTETGVEPRLSRVAFVDGRPASFCLGAVRGEAASIRGEGTIPRYRRMGLGVRVLEATMDALREAGGRWVGLEVLTGNTPALELYLRCGFEMRRQLLGYTLSRPPRSRASPELADVETPVAVARLVEWGWPDPPWQLHPLTLEHVPAMVLDDRAVLLGKRRGERFWLYAISVRPDHRRRGLATSALAALPSPWIAVPALLPEEWHPAHEFLRAAGASPERYTQYEMSRAL